MQAFVLYRSLEDQSRRFFGASTSGLSFRHLTPKAKSWQRAMAHTSSRASVKIPSSCNSRVGDIEIPHVYVLYIKAWIRGTFLPHQRE